MIGRGGKGVKEWIDRVCDDTICQSSHESLSYLQHSRAVFRNVAALQHLPVTFLVDNYLF